MKSLGFVEVSGMVAAVEAVDAMLKSSNVKFLTWEKKLGGRLVTIIVEGDVASVTQAVEVGAEVGNKITKTVASAVIAKPHEEIGVLIEMSKQKNKF